MQRSPRVLSAPCAPAQVRPSGGECSGLVKRKDESCKRLALGQRAFGLSPGCLRTFSSTSVDYVAQIPEVLTFEQAACLPVLWTTVHYSMREGRLHRAQTALVHAISGGVGMVCLDYSQSIAAKLIATAGRPTKHGLARRRGVELLGSSRQAGACPVLLPFPRVPVSFHCYRIPLHQRWRLRLHRSLCLRSLTCLLGIPRACNFHSALEGLHIGFNCNLGVARALSRNRKEWDLECAARECSARRCGLCSCCS